MPIAPAVVRAKTRRERRATGSRRLSPREWFTAYFAASSPVTGLFATVASRIDDSTSAQVEAGCISNRT